MTGADKQIFRLAEIEAAAEVRAGAGDGDRAVGGFEKSEFFLEQVVSGQQNLVDFFGRGKSTKRRKG